MYIVERRCSCATGITPGYVGADGHSCPRCEGNLTIEVKVTKPNPLDRVLGWIEDDEPDYS